MATIDRVCKKCGKPFKAKAADVKRGWAKCCSKACAAHMREKKLDRFDYRHGGQNPGFKAKLTRAMSEERMLEEIYESAAIDHESGWDGYKSVF